MYRLALPVRLKIGSFVSSGSIIDLLTQHKRSALSHQFLVPNHTVNLWEKQTEFLFNSLNAKAQNE